MPEVTPGGSDRGRRDDRGPRGDGRGGRGRDDRGGGDRRRGGDRGRDDSGGRRDRDDRRGRRDDPASTPPEPEMTMERWRNEVAPGTPERKERDRAVEKVHALGRADAALMAEGAKLDKAKSLRGIAEKWKNFPLRYKIAIPALLAAAGATGFAAATAIGSLAWRGVAVTGTWLTTYYTTKTYMRKRNFDESKSKRVSALAASTAGIFSFFVGRMLGEWISNKLWPPVTSPHPRATDLLSSEPRIGLDKFERPPVRGITDMLSSEPRVGTAEGRPQTGGAKGLILPAEPDGPRQPSRILNEGSIPGPENDIIVAYPRGASFGEAIFGLLHDNDIFDSLDLSVEAKAQLIDACGRVFARDEYYAEMLFGITVDSPEPVKAAFREMMKNANMEGIKANFDFGGKWNVSVLGREGFLDELRKEIQSEDFKGDALFNELGNRVGIDPLFTAMQAMFNKKLT